MNKDTWPLPSRRPDCGLVRCARRPTSHPWGINAQRRRRQFGLGTPGKLPAGSKFRAESQEPTGLGLAETVEGKWEVVRSQRRGAKTAEEGKGTECRREPPREVQATPRCLNTKREPGSEGARPEGRQPPLGERHARRRPGCSTSAVGGRRSRVRRGEGGLGLGDNKRLAELLPTRGSRFSPALLNQHSCGPPSRGHGNCHWPCSSHQLSQACRRPKGAG